MKKFLTFTSKAKPTMLQHNLQLQLLQQHPLILPWLQQPQHMLQYKLQEQPTISIWDFQDMLLTNQLINQLINLFNLLPQPLLPALVTTGGVKEFHAEPNFNMGIYPCKGQRNSYKTILARKIEKQLRMI